MKVDVSTAEALLDFDKFELKTWSKLVKLDGNVAVLLLVLEVFWKDDA